MQPFDDPTSDRCRYCGMPTRYCDCDDSAFMAGGRRCMNGHVHLTETDAVMCELEGPKEDV